MEYALNRRPASIVTSLSTAMYPRQASIGRLIPSSHGVERSQRVIRKSDRFCYCRICLSGQSGLVWAAFWFEARASNARMRHSWLRCDRRPAGPPPSIPFSTNDEKRMKERPMENYRDEKERLAYCRGALVDGNERVLQLCRCTGQQ